MLALIRAVADHNTTVHAGATKTPLELFTQHVPSLAHVTAFPFGALVTTPRTGALKLGDPPFELAIHVAPILTGPRAHVVVDKRLADVLRPHQREGVRFLWRSCAIGSGGILADSMGLGKTLQTIAFLWTALRSGGSASAASPLIKKAIIACPSSLVGLWAREIKKWLGDERLRPCTLTGGAGAASAPAALAAESSESSSS
jgi:hypothetical protein